MSRKLPPDMTIEQVDKFLAALFAPRQGTEFEHPSVKDGNTCKPLRYRVTKLARNVVYFRPIRGGKVECISRDLFWDWVKGRHPWAKT